MTLVVAASAAPITPTFDTFGTLPGATFGGSGIPNNAVAITHAVSGMHDVVLGLTAHHRFLNPTVTNDGNGTFFATPGANFGDPTFATMPSSTLGATWNFAFYVDVHANSNDVLIRLLYDFDPGYFTDESNHGVIQFAVPHSAVVEVQQSQNLLFGFLSVPLTGPPVWITPPPGSFNPNVAGSYTFALRAYSLSGDFLGEAAIRVNVGQVVIPEPTSLAVWCLCGVGSLVAIRRVRWRNKKPALGAL
jgi:hypothetical protein